jgi:hypothetical protein
VHTTHGEKLPERKETPEMSRDAHAAASAKLEKQKREQRDVDLRLQLTNRELQLGFPVSPSDRKSIYGGKVQVMKNFRS